MINQDFELMDKVSTWTNDLEALQIIKGQRYKILLNVYTREELAKIDVWIEKIQSRNRVMLALYEDIQEIEDMTQAQLLEANKYYYMASLEIFGG